MSFFNDLPDLDTERFELLACKKQLLINLDAINGCDNYDAMQVFKKRNKILREEEIRLQEIYDQAKMKLQ